MLYKRVLFSIQEPQYMFATIVRDSLIIDLRKTTTYYLQEIILFLLQVQGRYTILLRARIIRNGKSHFIRCYIYPYFTTAQHYYANSLQRMFIRTQLIRDLYTKGKPLLLPLFIIKSSVLSTTLSTYLQLCKLRKINNKQYLEHTLPANQSLLTQARLTNSTIKQATFIRKY